MELNPADWNGSLEAMEAIEAADDEVGVMAAAEGEPLPPKLVSEVISWASLRTSESPPPPLDGAAAELALLPPDELF